MTARIVLTLGGNSRATDECYIKALSLPGFDLEVVPLLPGMPEGEVQQLLRGADGLVLSGGADVHPERYGQAPDGAEMKYVSPERDATEAEALDEADELGLPILAICRGMQMLNVNRGGTLLQDIGESHRDGRKQADKWMPFHEVEFDARRRPAMIFGSQAVRTNSRHHQALDPTHLGEGLRAAGWCATDRVIEAVADDGPRFVVGVQWHPENMAIAEGESVEREQARALFAAFAAEAQKYRQER